MRDRFPSPTRTLPRQLRASRARRMSLECLEGRELLTTISIGDASALEGSAAMKYLDRFVPAGSGGLSRPRSLIFGPDGNQDGAQDLYIVDINLNAVLRYDGVTGAFIDTFVASGSGGLDRPYDLTFGPDSNLYVSDEIGNEVLRYDGTTGAFLGAVVGGLSRPFGLTFSEDGSLYIANEGSNEVLRYNSSGLSTFVTAGSGSLSGPRRAIFGPDGNGDGSQDLYVTSANGKVLRYDGLTGGFIDTFATTGSTQGPPVWMQFGTDGYLYTTARTSTADPAFKFSLSCAPSGGIYPE